MKAKQSHKKNKKSKKGNKPQVPDKVLSGLKLGLFIALSIILFYPPYVRGLFFELEQIPAIIFVLSTFVVFWIYKYLKGDGRFLKTPLDYAALAFIIVYFISIFAAVALRQAILEWLKYCMYFAVFYMLAELADSLKWRLAVLWVMVASATGVSVLGIDGAAGGGVAQALNKFFKGLGAGRDIFFDTFVNGRVHSTLQYPNALAAYLMAVYFVCLGLIISSGRLWPKIIGGALSSVLFITFLLTISRGAYLLFPVAALLYLILLPKERRIRGAVFGLATTIPSLIVLFRISPYITKAEGQASVIWLNVLICAIVSALLVIIGNYAAKWLEKVGWKVYAVLAGFVIIVGIACGIYVFNASVPLILDNSMLESNKRNSVTQSVTLEPGKEYMLSFEAEASDKGDNPYVYQVTISSKSIKDILFNTSTRLETYSQKGTSGTPANEIVFIVPEDSKIVDFTFTNYYAGTKAVIDKAKIIDSSTGKIYKELMLSNKYLPIRVITRFNNLGIDKSTLQRAVYYKDGLKMFKDRWFLGAGGGAWALLYFSYQSYHYWSTQAHNYPLQVAVECGIFGIIVLLLLIASIIYMVVKLYRKSSERNPGPDALQASLLSAVAALLVHSVMDFDFSLASVFLLFWELTAVFSSTYIQPIRDQIDVSTKDKSYNSSSIIAAAVSFVILIVPVFMQTAASFRSRGEDALSRQDLESALANYKKASSLDPFEPGYLIDYVNLLLQKVERTKEDIEEATGFIARAENLSSRNYKLLSKVATYYLNIGNIEKGLQLFDRSVELCPFFPEVWQQKINAYMQVVFYHFKNDQSEAGLEYVDKTLAIVDEAKEVNKRNMNPFIFNGQTMEMLEKLKYLKDKIGKQEIIDISKTAFYSMNDLDINFDSVPDQWTASSQEYIKLAYDNGDIKVENNSEDEGKWGYIQSRELNLLPDKEYIISVELDSGDEVKPVSYYVNGITDKAIALKSTGNNFYTGEFSTPADFNNEKCRLRLYLKDDIRIKSVSVLEK
ncbi:MAG TPA: hypothetical protein GXX36_10775 [Clostridiaceae bacterium]|nr:hypothetical protein [Clostridiaceae bacterium]